MVTKTAEQRAAQRAENARIRHEASTVAIAWADEVSRLNHKIKHEGAVAILDTAFGLYRVLGADTEGWVRCVPIDLATESATSWNTRSFILANDGRWASLLQQAGCPRNALWAQLKPTR